LLDNIVHFLLRNKSIYYRHKLNHIYFRTYVRHLVNDIKLLPNFKRDRAQFKVGFYKKVFIVVKTLGPLRNFNPPNPTVAPNHVIKGRSREKSESEQSQQPQSPIVMSMAIKRGWGVGWVDIGGQKHSNNNNNKRHYVR
jgi:hypothetical protein